MTSTVTLPQQEWNEFLPAFTRRHHGWLVTIETHDLGTSEDVASRFMPLESVECDLEDQKNPRINVRVHSEEKEIKHILFRPTLLVLYLSADGAEEGLRIESVNTSTTVRFRVAAKPESVDNVA
jgi:hypothetical protein